MKLDTVGYTQSEVVNGRRMTDRPAGGQGPPWRPLFFFCRYQASIKEVERLFYPKQDYWIKATDSGSIRKICR